MKKWITMLLALAMVLALAACGEDVPPVTTNGQSGNPVAPPATGAEGDEPVATTAPEKVFAFTFKNTEISLHADAAPILAALGQPLSYTESASCAFEGKDKTYNYGSFVLTTYPQGDQDFVFSFWFVDDSVTTQEGLFIGAPQAQAEAVCGSESFNGLNAYVKDQGDTRMTVIIADGLISSIQYTIMLG